VRNKYRGKEAASDKRQAASRWWSAFIAILVGKMKNFKQLLIWQKGIQIAVQAFQLVSSFPKEEKFSLSNQITRAGVSVSSNIAEGSSRGSEKDYRRFLELSLGSCFELETQLLIADAVQYGDKQLRQKLLQDVQDEQKMLVGFMAKLAK
jgi:four helix bundle protein